MAFAPETLDELERHRLAVQGQHDQMLIQAYRTYNSADARENALHGFCRRLRTLKVCIENVFALCPPDSTKAPEDIEDVTINIQAFIFNLYGALDNLAWIWVFEKKVTHPDGTPLKPGHVGLGPKFASVRKSLSPELQAKLKTKAMRKWFVHIEDYRHALAHRIPLYIPPYLVDPKHQDRHYELSCLAAEAFGRQDYEEYDRLEAEQLALGWFDSCITHSITKARAVLFHPGLLANWRTLQMIFEMIIYDLDNFTPAPAEPALRMP
ncbi:hypothetical protein [Ferrovibrio sp.]|uniref:hypothetical protein n=1 Tax=Ferrovibrio sp. TaxID=1917215 RepID=UPI000CADFDDB|nr:hypothetical protein [Ferrovibrio sp.]PJI39444.1 MAG: hypothetical protein CTR53_12835 [Ferrovibrio sp.]